MDDSGAPARLTPVLASREDAVFRSVRGGNAFEEAVSRIVQAIKLGIVERGERLPPERELAVRLGVSRVTLREAIRALQQAGYVQSRRGRGGGTFVTAQHTDGPAVDAASLAHQMGASLIDALDFRNVLEPGAAELAAARSLDAATRSYLVERLEETCAAEPHDYRRSDSRLHLAIAEAAGSPSLLAAVADSQLRLNDLLNAIPLLPTAIDHSNEHHREIIAAIVKGRRLLARAAMEEHLAATASLLRGFLG